MFSVFYDLSLEKDKQNKSPTSKTAYTFSDLCMDGSVAPAAPATKGEATAAAPASTPTPPTPTTAQTTNQITTSMNAKIGNLATTPSQASSPLLHSVSAKSARKSTTTSEQDSSPDLEQEKGYILVTTVSGEALNEYQKLSDMEIVSKCLTCLRHMFPLEDVPTPSGHVVSRWGADPFAQMSYSYAAVGSTGEDYDYMAQDVAGKIFFAGEVCLQQFC